MSFLLSYYNTFNHISLGVEEIIKGKSPMYAERPAELLERQVTVPCKPWPNPQAGSMALSVDGSYNATDDSAGSGMILRDDKGGVIFATYRKLFHCNEALEVELHALLEGLN